MKWFRTIYQNPRLGFISLNLGKPRKRKNSYTSNIPIFSFQTPERGTFSFFFFLLAIRGSYATAWCLAKWCDVMWFLPLLTSHYNLNGLNCGTFKWKFLSLKTTKKKQQQINIIMCFHPGNRIVCIIIEAVKFVYCFLHKRILFPSTSTPHSAV